jgi:hypothetical protein
MSLGIIRALGLRENRGDKVKIELDLQTFLGATGGSTNSSLSSTELILSLLQQQGFNVNQEVAVNITDIIDRFNITINPLIRRLIQLNDPVKIPIKTVITMMNIQLKIEGEYTSFNFLF